VSIGEPPEVTGFTGRGEPVIIGSRVRIREFVTIHSGWKSPTIIACDAQIFRHAHIAHDCCVAEYAIVSGGAIMCGHSVLQDHAVLSAGAILHQFVVVGQGAFIGAGAVVTRHVKPLDKVAVRSPVVVGSNTAKANLVDWNLALEFFYAAQERKDPCDGRSEERKILS
jgi:acyl-[acyl carrier protein]--UDP-N-acetylglucosamine O-acyltransferase